MTEISSRKLSKLIKKHEELTSLRDSVKNSSHFDMSNLKENITRVNNAILREKQRILSTSSPESFYPNIIAQLVLARILIPNPVHPWVFSVSSVDAATIKWNKQSNTVEHRNTEFITTNKEDFFRMFHNIEEQLKVPVNV